MTENTVASAEVVEQRIYLIRGKRIILDADVAALYGTTTKRLNEQVKRNLRRFPEDFVFQLSQDERAEVVANCDHLKNIKYSKVLPYAFTEHGALMAANVLNSRKAEETSVYVIRAFVRMRELSADHKDIMQKIEQLEIKYDGQF